MNKKLKKQKGFTLVEVIVVAVIVAILAAVAVPIYLNYVENSRRSQANNIAGAVASFCGACGAEGGQCAPHATDPEATCSANNTTIALPVEYTVAITGNPGAGTVQATSVADATIQSELYNY